MDPPVRPWPIPPVGRPPAVKSVPPADAWPPAGGGGGDGAEGGAPAPAVPTVVLTHCCLSAFTAAWMAAGVSVRVVSWTHPDGGDHPVCFQSPGVPATATY